LHDYGTEMGLVLKWTPNWAMAPNGVSAPDEHDTDHRTTSDALEDANMPDTQRE
uniref:MBL fold metallo-hydrolase n=1 Tax=Echinostoma caproni TaxID=27848 RepID=A0A183A2U3_9TREM